MKLKYYTFTLTGVTPLILHQDSVEWSDKMQEWRKDSSNAKKSVAGDDRAPAWRWIGCLPTDGEKVGITADMLLSMLTKAGSKLPTGKKQTTFKNAAATMFNIVDPLMPVVCGGGSITAKELQTAMEEENFAQHQKWATSKGFELFVKRAAVQNSKHIRVRPMFRQWSISGQVEVFDDTVTAEVLTNLFGIAGRSIGLGDWRPSSKTPGRYGRFTSKVEAVK